VAQGNLQVGVGGVGRTGGGVVNVSAGATLSGSGVIGGTPSVTSHVVGGILSPGDNGGALKGTLSVNGNMTLNPGAQIAFGITGATGVYGGNMADLDVVHAIPTVYAAALNNIASTFGTAAAGDHDKLVVDGVLTLSVATTIVVNDLGASLTLGNVYNLIDAGAIVGTSFNTGGAQRNGGMIGNLFLPTLAAGLKWDTTKFLSHGLLVIVDPPIYWKGGNTTAGDPTSWNNGSNWNYDDGSVAGSPTQYSEVVLSSSDASVPNNMTLAQDVTVKQITVTDSNTTNLSGSGTVTIKPLVDDGSAHDAIKVASTAGQVTINTGVKFAQGARITVDNMTPQQAAGLVLQGRVSANTTLIKAGAGTLALNNAILAVGDQQGAGPHNLNVVFEGTGGLSMNNATLEMDIFSNGGSDRITFTGSLDGGNSVDLKDVHFVVNADPNMTFNGGNSWDLFDWSNLNFTMTFSDNIASFFNLPTLGSGLTWGFDRFMSHGQIYVVPEPGRAMLLLLGLLAFCMRRRRNRSTVVGDDD
jgi:hypothetical protein